MEDKTFILFNLALINESCYIAVGRQLKAAKQEGYTHVKVYMKPNDHPIIATINNVLQSFPE